MQLGAGVAVGHGTGVEVGGHGVGKPFQPYGWSAPRLAFGRSAGTRHGEEDPERDGQGLFGWTGSVDRGR